MKVGRTISERMTAAVGVALVTVACAAGPAHAGTAMFNPHIESTTNGAGGAGVTTGDFNRDGRADVATASRWGSLSILAGSGDGTFQPPATRFISGTETHVGDLATADFNRDGFADLAAALGDHDTVAVLYGRGDGGFDGLTGFGTGDGPSGLAVGNVNFDDVPDIVTANPASDTVSVLLGRGDGTFAPKVDYPTGGAGSADVAIADLNGDHVADLAATTGAADGIAVLLGNANGNGTFAPHTDVSLIDPQNPFSVGPGDIAAADVDGDGDQDLVANGYDTLNVVRGTGDGTFGTAVKYPALDFTDDVVIRDIDGDDVLDLLAVSGAKNRVSINFGNGNGTFGPRQDLPTGETPGALRVVDLNRDDRPDILTTNESHTVSALINAQWLRPIAVTTPASDITQTAATLNSTVNPRGWVTGYRFEYGTTTAYGRTILGGYSGTGGETELRSLRVADLEPATTYHYRVVAVSPAGTTYGRDLTFTTPATRPPTPDLGLTIATPAGHTTVGESLRYTLTVTNHGDLDATNVVVTDPLPGGVTFDAARSDRECRETNGTITCEAQSVAAGASVSFEITVTPSARGTLVNTARVGSQEPDADHEDNTATSRVAVDAPPSAATGPGSDVTSSSATLNGYVDPQGQATEYRFEYGTSTTYDNATADAAAGDDPAAVEAVVNGLSPATTYHYRVVATNAAGTSYGVDRTFTTPARTSPGDTPPSDTHDETPSAPAAPTGDAPTAPQTQNGDRPADRTPGSSTSPATNEGTARRQNARGLTVRVTPRRPRSLPRTLTITGKLVLPAGVDRAAGCGGRVTIQVTLGGRKRASKQATLKPDCTYKVRVRLSNGARAAASGRLSVTAKFGGNAALNAGTRSAASVRVG